MAIARIYGEGLAVPFQADSAQTKAKVYGEGIAVPFQADSAQTKARVYGEGIAVGLGYPYTCKTLNGKASICLVAAKTLLGKSNVTLGSNTARQTLAGKSYIVLVLPGSPDATLGSGETGALELGQVQVGPATTTTQTLYGKSRLVGAGSQTLAGKSRLTVSSQRTLSGESRVQISTSQTLTGISRATNSASRTISGQSRILLTSVQTRYGKANIAGITSRTLTGRGCVWIASATAQTLAGKASIITVITNVHVDQMGIEVAFERNPPPLRVSQMGVEVIIVRKGWIVVEE